MDEEAINAIGELGTKTTLRCVPLAFYLVYMHVLEQTMSMFFCFFLGMPYNA